MHYDAGIDRYVSEARLSRHAEATLRQERCHTTGADIAAGEGERLRQLPKARPRFITRWMMLRIIASYATLLR